MQWLNEIKEAPKNTRLPYCHIINPPNIPENKIRELNMDFGVFIPKMEAESAKMNLAKLEECGFISSPQSYSHQDQEVIVDGFVGKKIKFCCLDTTPIMVVSRDKGREQIAGFYYSQVGQGVSDIGKLCAGSKQYKRKAWWMIYMLGDNNQPLHEIPFSFSLKPGTGGAFNNQKRDLIEEINQAIAITKGEPEVQIDSSFHKYIIHSWSLGFHKADSGKAPYVFPSARAGVTEDPRVADFHGRKTKIIPTLLTDVLIQPSSELGQLVNKTHQEYIDSFLKNINYFKNSQAQSKPAIDAIDEF